MIISGRSIEEENFWEKIKVGKFKGDFNDVGLVIYPTYIENQPRQILKAISKGIPIITKSACGLDNLENIKIVDLGRYEQLKNEVTKDIETR